MITLFGPKAQKAVKLLVYTLISTILLAYLVGVAVGYFSIADITHLLTQTGWKGGSIGLFLLFLFSASLCTFLRKL